MIQLNSVSIWAVCTCLIVALLVTGQAPASSQRNGISDPFFSSFHGSLKQKRDELIKRFLIREYKTLHLVRARGTLSQVKVGDYGPARRVAVNFKEDRPTSNREATLRELLCLMSNEMLDPKHRLFTSAAQPISRIDPSPPILQFDRFPHQRSHAAIFVPLPIPWDPRYCAHITKLTYMIPRFDKPVLYHDLTFSNNSFNSSHIGWMMGIAILNKQFLDVSFTSLFYKLLMIQRTGLEDIKLIQPELAKRLEWVMYFDQSLDELNRTLTYQYYDGREMKNRDLVLNADVAVQNKTQYVDKMVEQYVKTHMEPAANALFDGLFEVIPREAFAMFEENELDILISGEPRISFEEWHKHARTPRLPTLNSRQVLKWFWQCVNQWDMDMRSRLLLYVTGTSRLPLSRFKGGSPFRSTWFNIEWSAHQTDVLPTSDPYKNVLYLPSYSSNETLKAMLEERLLDQGGVRTWYASATRFRYIPQEPKSTSSCWPGMIEKGMDSVLN